MVKWIQIQSRQFTYSVDCRMFTIRGMVFEYGYCMSCERRSSSIEYMYQHTLSHVKSSTTRVMDCGLSGSDHSRIHGMMRQ